MVGTPRPGRPSDHSRPMPDSPSFRVLVADDDQEMRTYIRHVLRDAAHVTEATTGTEALTLARQTRPDLVIADVRMPYLDGYALCTALHDDAVTATVPVLLVSGEPAPAVGAASAFLPKPFNASGLRAAVALLLPDGTPPAHPSDL